MNDAPVQCRNAADQLIEAMHAKGTCACVGIDPVLERILIEGGSALARISAFCLGVIDAVHEHVVRIDVVGDLVAREPQLDCDVVFGIRAHAAVENRLADAIMANGRRSSWKVGQLRTCGRRRTVRGLRPGSVTV